MLLLTICIYFTLVLPCYMISNGCTMDGKTYAVGKNFIPDSCMGICKCNRPGSYSCSKMCAPSYANCGPYKREITVRKHMALNKKCYCERKKCVPVHCEVGGKLYKPGESFVTSDCTGRCYCIGPGYNCVSLCPPSNCAPGKFKRMTKELASTKPLCYCDYPECAE